MNVRKGRVKHRTQTRSRENKSSRRGSGKVFASSPGLAREFTADKLDGLNAAKQDEAQRG
jgi:hypothetical protein